MTISIDLTTQELEVIRSSLRRHAKQLEQEGFQCDDVIDLRIKIANILKEKP